MCSAGVGGVPKQTRLANKEDSRPQRASGAGNLGRNLEYDTKSIGSALFRGAVQIVRTI